MNKSEFVAALALHGAMSKADAEKCYQVFRHTLETELLVAEKSPSRDFVLLRSSINPRVKRGTRLRGKKLKCLPRKVSSLRRGKSLLIK